MLSNWPVVAPANYGHCVDEPSSNVEALVLHPLVNVAAHPLTPVAWKLLHPSFSSVADRPCQTMVVVMLLFSLDAYLYCDHPSLVAEHCVMHIHQSERRYALT